MLILFGKEMLTDGDKTRSLVRDNELANLRAFVAALPRGVSIVIPPGAP